MKEVESPTSPPFNPPLTHLLEEPDMTITIVPGPPMPLGPHDATPRRRLPEPKVKTTRYDITLLPEEHPLYSQYVIVLKYRGNHQWAITRIQYCLGRDGKWSFESAACLNDPDWQEQHLFPLSAALRLANEEAPRIVVNGRTAHTLLAGA